MFFVVHAFFNHALETTEALAENTVAEAFALFHILYLTENINRMSRGFRYDWLEEH